VHGEEKLYLYICIPVSVADCPLLFALYIRARTYIIPNVHPNRADCVTLAHIQSEYPSTDSNWLAAHARNTNLSCLLY